MNRLFPIINILLITAISFLSVDTAYKIIAAQLNPIDWHKPTIFRNGSSLSLNPPEFEKPPLSSYKAIVERDIFQTSTISDNSAEKIIAETIKPTEKDLKLWGTVVASDPARAYAIIEEPGTKRRQRSQHLYRHGDIVQGASIKTIMREKVILSVNGDSEILHIVKPQSTRGVRTNRTAYNRRNSKPIRQKRILRSSQIQKAVSNIENIMSQAKIRPHSEGFQITRIRPSSIFRRMGLRNGDIITAVGRRPIHSVNDAIDILQDFTAGSQTSVELKRRGRTRIIDYRIM